MTYYITTPLFYVNDLPHIGSAYPTIVCDYIAGHIKQRGEKVCFLTGTDEHGQKIEKSAKENGKTPQQHCDEYAAEFKKLWDILDINYQYFVRTTDQVHKDYVTEFFKEVQANGDIYKGEYKGLYCVHCEDFWLEKDAEEIDDELCCPTHKKKLEEYSQENYFFKLSKYQELLKDHIDKNPDFISPDYRKNEVLGWIKEGLRDFPISRANLEWGIKVPGDDSQVIYVWFDALLGYISGLKDQREDFWQEEIPVHVIGKDILRFHAVYWPAMLMAADMPLPKKVFGHGFLTKDGMKMGKTLGNVIDPIELSEKFGAEAVKYYFLRDIVFGRDGDFTDEGFVQVLNTDLANNLGNLLNRSLKLINKYCNGVVPQVKIAENVEKLFHELRKDFEKDIEELNPYTAFESLFKAVSEANVYINDIEPWKVLKKEGITDEEAQESYTSLASSVFACFTAGVYLAPVMPELSKKIFLNLGFFQEADLENISRDELLEKLPLSLLDKLSIDKVFAMDLNVSSSPQAIFQRIQAEEKAPA